MTGGRLNRYMLTQTLSGLGLALLTITTVIVLVDFVEQSRAIGTRVDVSTLDLLGLTLLKTPLLLETTLPFIFLFGILTSLFRLNRRSELIVMRASGMEIHCGPPRAPRPRKRGLRPMPQRADAASTSPNARSSPLTTPSP